jgi:FkbH-like protein
MNEALCQEMGRYSNAFFFDLNEIQSFYGKRYVQEDGISAINHGAYIGNFDFEYDANRLEPAAKASDFFESKVHDVFLASWRELVALYNTVRQTDAVKLVVIDLDDTLWRGVIAEKDAEDMPTSEGWPKGFWEALLFLKRRGILLAIISKNEESRVAEAWDKLVSHQLKLDDFAIRRINWRPKPENMADILAHVNLLPSNVVYIDDNPAERAGMKGAYPDMRVLGGTPLTWRRILLWSSETQVPTITAESSSRTEMVRAQVVREEKRATMSREEFLASLDVRMKLLEVRSVDHPRFPRVFELINKTNQFNTTGKRWTREECGAAFASGTTIHAFEVADLYTEYGLVGALMVDADGIRQFVMSCRVMGLEAEVAAVARVGDLRREAGSTTIFAAMIETNRNQPCRNLYSRFGFEAVEGGWRRSLDPWFEAPAHIALTIEQEDPETIRVAAE